jgi:hypothetical protein
MRGCVPWRTNDAAIGDGWVCAATRPQGPEDGDPADVEISVGEDMKVIRFIFKLIHFNSHSLLLPGVEQTFFRISLILGPLVVFPILTIFHYANDKYNAGFNKLWDLAIVGFVYFLYRRAEKPIIKSFVMNGYDKEFYDWGRYNTILKLLISMILLACAGLICRLMYILIMP